MLQKGWEKDNYQLAVILDKEFIWSDRLMDRLSELK